MQLTSHVMVVASKVTSLLFAENPEEDHIQDQALQAQALKEAEDTPGTLEVASEAGTVDSDHLEPGQDASMMSLPMTITTKHSQKQIMLLIKSSLNMDKTWNLFKVKIFGQPTT